MTHQLLRRSRSAAWPHLAAAAAWIALAAGCGRVTMMRDAGGAPDTKGSAGATDLRAIELGTTDLVAADLGAVDVWKDDAGSSDTGSPDVGSLGASSRDTGSVDGTAMQGLPVPPATWTEHWFEHNQTLDLVAHNDHAAIYFDRSVARAGTEWILPFITGAWQYTQRIYGDFKTSTSDPRFYAIFHQDRYVGCHVAYHADPGHDYRNVTDCGAGPWTTPTQLNLVGPLFWMGSVVEFNNNHINFSSPAHNLWDARFKEFFIYDLLLALGRTSEAQLAYDAYMVGADTRSPRPIFWFRDWFFPLWRDHGHGEVMARFFKLVSQYFRVAEAAPPRGTMTLPVMVHFMSGAAGTNLKARALTAFGAEAVKDADLQKARVDFPQITY